MKIRKKQKKEQEGRKDKDMSTYEVITVMLAFGMLLISLIFLMILILRDKDTKK